MPVDGISLPGGEKRKPATVPLPAIRRMLLTASLCLTLQAANGQNWMPGAGIPAVPVLGMTEQGGNLYAITLDSVYRSRDSGATWVPTPVQPGKPMQLMALQGYGGYLYLGTTAEGIFRTTDGGQWWESFNEGYPGSAVVQVLSLGDSLYVGTDANGVYVRNPLQASPWMPFNNGLDRVGVQTMATSGDLLLATVGMSTYARMRGSPAWTEILLDSAGEQLEVKEFLRLGNYLFAGVGTGIFRGTPDAQSWEKVGISLLPLRSVTQLAVHGNRLLAGVPFRLEHFICMTDDAGDSWGVKAHEFAELLGMEVIGNRLFAARSDGLWYLDLEEPTGVPNPGSSQVESFRLEQNYPNPFNGRTVISSQYPVASWVKLAVYDLLGREVAVLVNEWRTAGSYEDVFSTEGGSSARGRDASGLASGVYIYRLMVGSSFLSRTMLLMR